MSFKKLICPGCGSDNVNAAGDGLYICGSCDAKYVLGLNAKDSEYIIEHTEKALWQQTVDKIEKTLFNLDEAVRKEFLDSEAIVQWCRELKRLIPAHFLAEFYETAVGRDRRALSEFISGVDPDEHEGEIPEILRIAIKLISAETLLAINDLIIRAYESKDVIEFSKWNKILHEEQQKVDGLVYDVKKKRDVFVAYKSEDWKDVEKLVDGLENEQGLTCFVAARNLQHGRAGDYDKKLETAMDSCRAVVFVSSRKSRSVGDARNKELPYIQKKDNDNAPPEYKARSEYKRLPKKYKKPRVEYVIEPYVGLAAEEFTNEFFDGYERVYKPDIKGVALSLFSQFDAPIEEEPKFAEQKPVTSDVKFCTSCGAENPAKAKFCSECGKPEFAETYEKYIEIKTERELREKLIAERQKIEAEYLDKLEAEYLAKLEAERKAKEQAERALKKERERQENEKAEREKQEKERLAREEAESKAREIKEQAERAARALKEASETREKEKAEKEKQERERLAQTLRAFEQFEKERAEKARAEKEKAAKLEAERIAREQAERLLKASATQQKPSQSSGYTEKVEEKQEYEFDAETCFNNAEKLYLKKNYEEAARWYKMAAEQGHARAQNNLGYCYEHGEGVMQNYYEAVKWYTKAAEKGNPYAQYSLGLCYENGRGVAKSGYYAVDWYRKASSRGHVDAKMALKRLGY